MDKVISILHAVGINPVALIVLPIAVIVLLTTLNYLWNRKVRPAQISRGRPTATFGNILGRTLTFMFKEDLRPIIPQGKDRKTGNLKPYPEKLRVFNKIFTWRNLYIALLVAVVITAISDRYLPSLYILGLLLISAGTRTHNVFSKRHNIFYRMFKVAATTLKLPRNADMNPWSYVTVKDWKNFTSPADTIVRFPAEFDTSVAALREKFEQHFNSAVSGDNQWVFEWNGTEGTIECKPVPHLETMIKYPGSASRPWNEIPLGKNMHGEFVWDVSKVPHALISGTTGAGKSTIQNNIIYHCIQHPDKWAFLGIDVKRVEFSRFKKYEPTVSGIALDIADGLEILRYANDEMMDRYDEMEASSIRNFRDLPNPPKALMIMIDETYSFLAPSKGSTDEAKETDAMQGEASVLCGKIARLGRAAGVHLILATQRPDATVIYGELKQNLGMRIAAGRADTTASRMTLDNDKATTLPGIRGRGYAQVDGVGEPFQGYYAGDDWADEYLSGDLNEKNEPDFPQDTGSVKKRKPKKDGLLAKIKEFNERSYDGEDAPSNDSRVVEEPKEDDEVSAKKPRKKGGLLGKIKDFNDNAYAGEEVDDSAQNDSNEATKVVADKAEHPKVSVEKEPSTPISAESTSLFEDESDYDDIRNIMSQFRDKEHDADEAHEGGSKGLFEQDGDFDDTFDSSPSSDTSANYSESDLGFLDDGFFDEEEEEPTSRNTPKKANVPPKFY